jgi:hypothetical protein
MQNNRPRFPLYIPSKGRSDSRRTSRALTEMNCPHYIVVEPHEVDAYRRACVGTLATIIELDMSYKARYELCDDLGLTKSTGPGPARNFIWDHSIAHGHAWHWVMDDNIRRFYRLNRNTKISCLTPTFWRAMEDFVLRYTNVAMAGPNYMMFKPCREASVPYTTNTRIYSCNLIRNDVPFRWRGRYNEDTILSLDMLKAGWCTVQFNAFLQDKMNTQLLGGGNTAEFYAREGTAPKSEMLKNVHPDVTKLVWRFNRHHHYVDYKRFKQPLLRDPSAEMRSSTASAMRIVKVSRA